MATPADGARFELSCIDNSVSLSRMFVDTHPEVVTQEVYEKLIVLEEQAYQILVTLRAANPHPEV